MTASNVVVNYPGVWGTVARAEDLVAEARRTLDTLGNVGVWIPGDFPIIAAADHMRDAHHALQRMRHTVEAAR